MRYLCGFNHNAMPIFGKRKQKKEEGRKSGAARFQKMKSGADARAIKRYESDRDKAEANKVRILSSSPKHTGGPGLVEERHVAYGRGRAAESAADTEIKNVEARKSSGAYQGNVMPSGGSKKQQRKFKKMKMKVGEGASVQAKRSARRLY